MAVRWRNVRGFEDTGWLNLRPLTVILGGNNSGKSTLHRPLLLLKQTLSADEGNAALVTRGSLASVGDFSDLVHRKDTTRSIGLGLRFGHLPNDRDPRPPLNSQPPAKVEVSFKSPDGRLVELSDYEVRDRYDRLLLSRRRRPGGSFSLRLLGDYLKLDPGQSNEAKVEYYSRVRSAIESADPWRFLFLSTPAINAAYTSPRSDSGRREPIPERAMQYISLTEIVRDQVARTLGSISYLGPLREPFNRYYEQIDEIPTDVGPGGSMAPHILAARDGDHDFRAWIDKWLARFGFRAPYEVERTAWGLYRLLVRTSPKALPVNVADCGFGLSQVLPFIVHGAHATPGSTLIAEQPEIHLNPKLQVVLADLLVDMVVQNRQVIVETHSEQLLTQLRIKMADRRLDSSKVAFYFVERGRLSCSVRELHLDEAVRWQEGDWPPEFFSEATQQALELLKARRRSTHRA